MAWASNQAPGFEKALDAHVKRLTTSNIAQYGAENKLLAYELSTQVDEKYLTYLTAVNKTNGAEMIRVLHDQIPRTSLEKKAALHDRFAKPGSCKVKEQLAFQLQQWREDLQELKASDAVPGRETIMSSLRLLIKDIRELKNTIELVDLLAPNNVKVLHAAVLKKANEWAVMSADARVTPAALAAKI